MGEYARSSFVKGSVLMLVLTRKPGETVVTSNGVTFQVLEINGRRVRIGITAPDDIRIRRGELPPKKQNDDSASAEEALFG